MATFYRLVGKIRMVADHESVLIGQVARPIRTGPILKFQAS